MFELFRALYVHCYGHSLNLGLKDTVEEITVLRDALDMCHEVIKVIKGSPQKEHIFRGIQVSEQQESDDNPFSVQIKNSLSRMCPTRWKLRADAIDLARLHSEYFPDSDFYSDFSQVGVFPRKSFLSLSSACCQYQPDLEDVVQNLEEMTSDVGQWTGELLGQV